MIHASERAVNFHYAIRHIVKAAETLEKQGRKITYLNIGDPQAFGFRPPPEIIEASNTMLSASACPLIIELVLAGRLGSEAPRPSFGFRGHRKPQPKNQRVGRFLQSSWMDHVLNVSLCCEPGH